MKTLRTFLAAAACLAAGLPPAAAQPDAGITAVVSPSIPFCPGSSPVVVMLTNLGADTLFTVTVNWTVNGAAQGPYAWSGVLAPAASDTVTLGTYLFNGKSSYAVMASSSLPNGMPDANPANDAFTAAGLKSRMSGNYSAGIVADYAVLLDAVNDLLNRGVCGPVTVNINPGIFSERLVIREIPGASAVNTVTFQSSTADSTSVIISQPSAPDAADNYTVRLDGADFITLRQLTVERSGGQPFGRVVEITGKAAGNVLTGLRIAGVPGATDASLAALVYSDTSDGAGYVDSLNAISGCAFLDGASGIYWAGPDPLLPEQDNSFTDNTFNGQTVYGMRLGNQSGVTVSGSSFRTAPANAGYTAAGLYGCSGKSVVLRNRVEDVPGMGLVFSKCTGDSVSGFTVANNFVQVSDSSGIFLDGSNHLAVVFNSVHQTAAATHSSALLLQGQSGQLSVVDNVLVNSGGGPALGIRDSAHTGLSRSDYNDWYAASHAMCDFNGTLLAGLSDWQQAAACDTHSVSADPGFTSASDLHASSWVIDNAGWPVGNVADDIDGELRSLTTPDIGADEFAALVHDLALQALIRPDASDCGDSAMIVQVAVSNTGSFPETGFTVSADLSGPVTVHLSMLYAGNLVPGAVDTIAFAQPVNTAGGGVYVVTASVFSTLDVIRTNDTLVVQATLHPRPVVSLGNDTVLNAPQTLLLDAGAGYAAYVWNTGDTTATLVVHLTGTYAVTVTDSNGCQGADSIQVTVLTGIGELAYGLEIYPNPAAGILSVSWPAPAGPAMSVEITDLSGRTVLRRQCQGVKGGEPVRIGLGGLASGNYVVAVSSGGVTARRMLVVQ